MTQNLFVFLTFTTLANICSAQDALDLIVPENGNRAIPAGMHEYRSVTINKGGRLIFEGAVVLSCDQLNCDQDATIEYKPQTPPDTQENLVIFTQDASGLKSLYISANGANVKYTEGSAAAGNPGEDGHGPLWKPLKHPKGVDAKEGAPGLPGASGLPGGHAANVLLNLPNLKPGSFVRVHANGGNGGNGQKGGVGGKGGDAAPVGHEPKPGGSGGLGGSGGRGGDAGKVYVALIVSDTASDADRKEKLKTIRIETANNGGSPGDGAKGGAGGQGGKHVAGAMMTGAKPGDAGKDGSNGPHGIDAKSKPDEKGAVIKVKTERDYAKEYEKILREIRDAKSKRQNNKPAT